MSFLRTLLSIVFVTNHVLARYSGYLEVERKFQKNNSDRTTLNTVWKRNRDQHSHIASNDFVFRAFSMETEANIQDTANNFIPQLSGRERRSSEHTNERTKKIVRRSCNNNDCKHTSSDEESILLSNSLKSEIKPTALNVDYPYEVSVLLGNHVLPENTTVNITKNKIVKKIIETLTDLNVSLDDTNEINLNNTNSTFNETDNTKELPNTKRFISKENYQNDILALDFGNNILPVDLTEDLTVSTEKYQPYYSNNVGYKFNYVVTTPPPVSQMTMVDTTKQVLTERGLMKLLSMLTKTFKKVIKQHEEMRTAHQKLLEDNDGIATNVSYILSKFDEFESKYQLLLDNQKRFKEIDAKMRLNENESNQKGEDLSNKMMEFVKEHKKFLAQQKQFFNIQKMILTQNDKINIKQNLIAKTQSEIIHRQTNFAKLLKKLKQLNLDRKHQKSTKLSVTIPKPKPPAYEYNTENKADTTTYPQTSTENVKINLFSILPPETPKYNVDSQILKEMSHENVDDLVYKYYFNNTFIDSAIRNGILANVHSGTFSSNNIKKRTKSKRKENKNNSKQKEDNIDKAKNIITENNDGTEKPTVLLPIKRHLFNYTDFIQNLPPRHRRWLAHAQVQNYKPTVKKFVPDTTINTAKKKFVPDTTINTANKKFVPDTTINTANKKFVPDTTINTANKKFVPEKKKFDDTKDPFVRMAGNFCMQIGENSTEQIFLLCVEKTLRRLKIFDHEKKAKKSYFKTVPQKISTKKQEIETTPTTPMNTMLGTTTLFEIRNYFPISISNQDPKKKMKKRIYKILPERILTKKQEIETLPPSVMTVIPKTTVLPIFRDKPLIEVINDDYINENINLHDYQAIDMDVTETVTVPEQHSNVERVDSSTQRAYFPDNDELEAYVKFYDLSEQDNEGTIYYDRSFHSSKMAIDSDDRDGGASDLLPGVPRESQEQETPPISDGSDLNRDAAIQRWNNRLFRLVRKQMMRKRKMY